LLHQTRRWLEAGQGYVQTPKALVNPTTCYRIRKQSKLCPIMGIDCFLTLSTRPAHRLLDGYPLTLNLASELARGVGQILMRDYLQVLSQHSDAGVHPNGLKSPINCLRSNQVCGDVCSIVRGVEKKHAPTDE
jgi:hypothetical protein